MSTPESFPFEKPEEGKEALENTSENILAGQKYIDQSDHREYIVREVDEEKGVVFLMQSNGGPGGGFHIEEFKKSIKNGDWVKK